MERGKYQENHLWSPATVRLLSNVEANAPTLADGERQWASSCSRKTRRTARKDRELSSQVAHALPSHDLPKIKSKKRVLSLLAMQPAILARFNSNQQAVLPSRGRQDILAHHAVSVPPQNHSLPYWIPTAFVLSPAIYLPPHYGYSTLVSSSAMAAAVACWIASDRPSSVVTCRRVREKAAESKA